MKKERKLKKSKTYDTSLNNYMFAYNKQLDTFYTSKLNRW